MKHGGVSARPKLAEPVAYDTMERAALAVEIAAQQAAAAVVTQLEGAEEALRQAVYRARRDVTEAEEAVAAAKDNATSYALALAVGEAVAAPVTVKAARIALQDVEDALQTAEETQSGLQDRVDAAKRHALDAAKRVRDAALIVLLQSPAVAAMTDRLYQAQRDLTDVAGAFLWLVAHKAWPMAEGMLGLMPNSPADERARHLRQNLYQPPIYWHAMIREVQSGQGWDAMLSALMLDAAAEIPA